HFQSAIWLQPGHFWAHSSAAVCSIELGRPSEAVAALNFCIDREPEIAWLYALRGYAEAAIPVGDRDPAERMRLQRAAEADYVRAFALLGRGAGAGLRYMVLVNRGIMWF